MIPKIIHYCWFGKNEIPESVKKYINTWKEILYDYEFILWNEENFDINISEFTKQAYKSKQYAFVSDYCRFYALKHYGGIYLDTDIELIKTFDDLLNSKYFLCFEKDENNVATCVIGSEKNYKFNDYVLDYYNDRNFIKEDGKLDTRPNTLIITELIEEGYNVEIKNTNKNTIISNDIIIYKSEYFCPLSLLDGKIEITKNTYAIHRHTLLWVSKKVKIVKFIRQKIFIPLFGINIYKKIEKNRKR